MPKGVFKPVGIRPFVPHFNARRSTPTTHAVADWVVGGRGIARQVSVPAHEFLGQEAGSAVTQVTADQVESYINGLSFEDQSSLVGKAFGLRTGDLQFVKVGPLVTGAYVSIDGFRKIIELRDRASRSFWDLNFSVFLLQEQGASEEVIDARRQVLVRVQAVAWALQELADQANIPRYRTVPEPRLSGIDPISWIAVVKVLIVLTALVIAVYTIFKIVALTVKEVVSGAASGITNTLEKVDSLTCDAIDRQIALLISKGSELTDAESKTLNQLQEKQRDLCRPRWLNTLANTALLVGVGWGFYRFIWPFLRPSKRPAAREEEAIPTGQGLFGGLFGKAKRKMLGIKTAAEKEYDTQRDFIECLKAADAATPWKRVGSPPKAWKQAYMSCRNTKFSPLPTAVGGGDFQRLMKVTGMK